MITSKYLDDSGIMSVRTSSYKEKKFIFKPETLKNWYPLNVNYEWRYSEVKDLMYLIMSEPKLTHTDYYIDSNVGRVESTHGTFSPESWHCDVVKMDNEKIIELAKGIGMCAFDTINTKQQLDENKQILSKYEMSHLNPIRRSAVENLSKEDQYKYYMMDFENKDSFALAHINEDQQKHLIEIGKLYVMQGIMLKMNRRG